MSANCCATSVPHRGSFEVFPKAVAVCVLEEAAQKKADACPPVCPVCGTPGFSQEICMLSGRICPRNRLLIREGYRSGRATKSPGGVKGLCVCHGGFGPSFGLQ